LQADAQLVQISDTFDLMCLLFCTGERRHQQCRQDCNNGDDDHYFNQSQPVLLKLSHRNWTVVLFERHEYFVGEVALGPSVKTPLTLVLNANIGTAAGSGRLLTRMLSRRSGLVSNSSDSDFGFNRIGDEALLMCHLMQVLLICGRGELVAAVGNLRMKRDSAHPGKASLVLGHHADGFVIVLVHLKALPAG